MNQVLLIGRLTKDPVLKYVQSGKAVCKFSLAVTREYNRDEADFISCIAWEKRAETIAEYLRKGKRIALQGRLNVRNYEQNGETKWITEVIVDKFEFVDAAGSQNQQSSYSQGAQSSNDTFADNGSEEIIDDEDFPF